MTRETYQNVVRDRESNVYQAAIDPSDARMYALKLFKAHAEGWGSEPRALEECARQTKMSERSFKRLMEGELKRPDLGVFARARKAYLDWCARKVAELTTELEIEKQRSEHVCIRNLDNEVQALARKIEAARSVRIGAE